MRLPWLARVFGAGPKASKKPLGSHRGGGAAVASSDDGLECSVCRRRIARDKAAASFYCCPDCGYHFRISPKERVALLCDRGLLAEINRNDSAPDPIGFPDYSNKIAEARQRTGLDEAIVTGLARIEGREFALGIMAFDFVGGSMGTVVGEKIARLVDAGIEKGIPVLLFTASGGARMQEGVFSLMQMAKVSAAAALLERARLPLIVVLTDPTTGGVTASIAMLGSTILAEPGALVRFAGKRVIEGTINQKLPDEFQRAEFQLQKGFVDAMAPRSEQRRMLSFLADAHRLDHRPKKWK